MPFASSEQIKALDNLKKLGVVPTTSTDPIELEAFGARTTVLVPMYDDCPKTKEHWVRYKGFKVLSFSRTLGFLLESWGLEVLTVQYFQPVPSRPGSFGKFSLRGFFWPRTQDLGWQQIKILSSQAQWDSFHLHVTNPEGQDTLPDREEAQELSLVQTDWFEDPEDYKRVLSGATVYFAPRKYEGIGQAVLEALALGLCVVAPDLPTMNEYIQHGFNGLLYDPNHPEPLGFSTAEALGQKARALALEGRKAWIEGLPLVNQFLLGTTPRSVRRFHPWVVFRGRFVAGLRALYRIMKGFL